ncbi:DNA recombination protein RmuC [Candidatus Methylacidithermus pantelleriae]|uniref:DNA recombination protein RmuC n=1 Tax=Candidatus Methylacidithermus pantelleriae TaxID=2744239 RepID=A0A8J2BP49_9BACT|nr:DNA recombination protein RmuC [Candidatus Methylacidithermus pantelleriae]CAF0700408.1 DNA recombination protein RmuC [Candidatus Methylacidithermus pantelleriae]
MTTVLTERDFLFFALGLLIGGALSWAISRVRWLTELVRRETQKQSLESLVSELREELQRHQSELAQQQELAHQQAQARLEAQTRWELAQKQLEEQRQLLEEAKNRLVDTFKALSADALQRNNQAFLELARQSLQTLLTEAKGELGQKEQALQALVRPLSEALERYETELKAIEESRQKAYGSLEEQLRRLLSVSDELRRETNQLVSAFRSPQVRGRWGELTLRRAAELAGMSAHCDYIEQPSLGGPGNRLRPDMVISLPSGREVVVDAKLPLDAYLDSLSKTSEEARAEALSRHARQLRDHIRALSEKGYWQTLANSPEFVVLFVPNDAVLSAALEVEPDLVETAIAQKVVLATPATFIALLRAIAYGWKQEELTRNAQKIAELGRQLYDRLKTFVEHFGDLGRSLERAVESFNRAVGSLETRVLPSARRFQELGVIGDEPISELNPVTASPRDTGNQEEQPNSEGGATSSSKP